METFRPPAEFGSLLMSAKRIVLTGATRGLGLAMTEKFIALGHVVRGCGRSAADVAGLNARFGPPHGFAVVDVAERAAVERWAGQVVADGGSPALLLNNAALMNRPAPLWEVPADEFERLIDVNVKGVVNVLRAFLPAMIAAGTGVVVNFSSGWGRSTSPQVAPYCGSKFAVEGLTAALAQELPPGLAAVALNPGIIDTDMLRLCWEEAAAQYPSPADWAEPAVPFLLRLGRSHNGRALTVPG
jgi:NAD(P)-dependent dehydrogenase (short-subunit alcohol dehydrogenase family)